MLLSPVSHAQDRHLETTEVRGNARDAREAVPTQGGAGEAHWDTRSRTGRWRRKIEPCLVKSARAAAGASQRIHPRDSISQRSWHYILRPTPPPAPYLESRDSVPQTPHPTVSNTRIATRLRLPGRLLRGRRGKACAGAGAERVYMCGLKAEVAPQRVLYDSAEERGRGKGTSAPAYGAYLVQQRVHGSAWLYCVVACENGRVLISDEREGDERE
jgi:hypothetical protein